MPDQSFGNYRYYADSGRTYQIALPSDFAVVLGYQAADPGDDFIPASISPRYIAYASIPSRHWMPVVSCNKAEFVSPPNPVTVDGIEFRVTGMYGERFNMFPGGNIITISGPPGLKGETGPMYAPDYQYAAQSSDDTISVANTFEAVPAMSIALVPGFWLIWAMIGIQTGAAAGRGHLRIYDNTSAVAYPGASHYLATVSQMMHLSCCTYANVTTISTFLAQWTASATSLTCRKNDPTNSQQLGIMTAIRVGDQL